MTEEEKLKVSFETSSMMVEKLLELKIDYIETDEANKPFVEVLKYLSDLLVLNDKKSLAGNLSYFLSSIYNTNQSISEIEESFEGSDCPSEILFREWIRLTQTIFCEIKYRYPRYINGYNLYENLYRQIEENVKWGACGCTSCYFRESCLR